MEYGNPPRVIYRVALIGFCIGALVVVAVLVKGLIEGSLVLHRLPWLLLALFAPSAVMVLAVAPTVFFRIRIADGRVQHIFLGRHVLSDYPLQDFLCLRRRERGCAAVLHFRDGGRIHFLGASLGEIARLARDLSERYDETTNAA